MDALKFLQTAKRICNTGCDKNLSCTGCCLHDFLCYCSDQTFTKIISTVERQRPSSKRNPQGSPTTVLSQSIDKRKNQRKRRR